jgi:hypothetical protein
MPVAKLVEVRVDVHRLQLTAISMVIDGAGQEIQILLSKRPLRATVDW